MQTTRVNFSETAATLKTQVMQVLPLEKNINRLALIFDTTNFHPIDYQWPDQPADKGYIEVQDQKFQVIDCFLAASLDSETLYFHQDIPVKRGTDPWQFVVAHIVEDRENYFLNHSVPELVLSIDTSYRHELSIAHSMCHLMALALNKISRPYWKEMPDRLDSLGNPDLDSLAISSSKLSPLHSVDCYRLGKSIRKKGFNASQFLLDKDLIAVQIQQQLMAWLAHPLTIQQSSFPALITDRRLWQCKLPDGEARIPCGGTHVQNLDSVSSIQIQCEVNAENGLSINTGVTT